MDDREVEDLFRRLTAQQKQELADRVAFEAARTPAPPSEDVADVLDAANAVTGTQMHYQLVAKKLGRAQMVEAAQQVVAYVARGSAGGLGYRPQRVALYREVLDCLAEELRKNGIPVSPVRLLQHVLHLASAVDLHYPGYAQAGCLDSIRPMQTAA